MVYIRKNRKKRALRICVVFFALAFLSVSVVRAVNLKLDAFIIPLARTGLTREITRLINNAVAEALEGNGAELAAAVYDSGGKMRSVKVDSLALSALRADISVRAAEKLATLENFCVTTDISDIVDDEVFLGRLPIKFAVDVIAVGGVMTDVKSEFVSAGINQTNYRLALTVSASITADVVSAFTVDVETSINLVDMLIIGDVPTVLWG